MTTAHVFFFLWLTVLFVALAMNLISIVRSVRKLRSARRDNERIVTAHVEGFEAADGWIRACVHFSNGKIETWVVESDGRQWCRLPDMIEASETWGAWLTHELGVENRKRIVAEISKPKWWSS